jgi:CheY-like chemotaxis protein
MTIPLRPHRVLLVDSDPRTAKVLGLLLTGDGFEVDVAKDGLAALSRFARVPLPDALICEVRVGPFDADAVARLARTHKPTLPVFVVTNDPRLIAGALCDPPPMVFTKPIDYPRLVSAIRTAVEQRQSSQ